MEEIVVFLVGHFFLASLAFEGAGAALTCTLPLVEVEGMGGGRGDVSIIETVKMRAWQSDSRDMR